MMELARPLVLGCLMVLGVAACGLRPDARPSLPARDSDELRASTGPVKPSALPPVGSRLTPADLQAFNQRSAGGRFKVTLAETDPTSTGQVMVIARDGNRAMSRVGAFSFFSTGGDKMIVCMENQGQAECEYDTEAVGTFQALGEDLLANAGTLRRTEDRVILGRTADCIAYSINTEDVTAEIETCADRETGALMLQLSDTGGQFVALEATDLTEPTAADFNPPAIPTG
jgi:hypothetical protein